MTVLLAAQRIVADIKKAMVPFYIEKAKAREDLAEAVTQEIPIRKAIKELGYDRIAVKTAEETSNHQVREAEETVELARLSWTKANKATELARTQSRRLLQEYANVVRAEILAKKKSLEMDGIDLRLTTSLARQAIGVNDDVAISENEIVNLTAELSSILSNLSGRASDEASKVAASASQISKTATTHLISRKIVEGAF